MEEGCKDIRSKRIRKVWKLDFGSFGSELILSKYSVSSKVFKPAQDSRVLEVVQLSMVISVSCFRRTPTPIISGAHPEAVNPLKCYSKIFGNVCARIWFRYQAILTPREHVSPHHNTSPRLSRPPYLTNSPPCRAFPCTSSAPP